MCVKQTSLIAAHELHDVAIAAAAGKHFSGLHTTAKEEKEEEEEICLSNRSGVTEATYHVGNSRG